MGHARENYGLENIVLHHSFGKFEGRTVRIECKNRTHVGGTNGAGKTSVLQLIPAFYGEEPERIVNRAAGNDSFVDYYLKSMQSLIIFEYRRSTGLCNAVLYRHKSGKLCYRFVEGSLNDTFFSEEGRHLLESGAASDEVFDWLMGQGTPVSSMIDTIMDYRAVIQRNPKLIRRQPDRRRRLQALARDYGLGDPDTRMSHIERLTHVVLNKNRLLSSFKSMICDTMFEDIHLVKRPAILYERDLVNDIRSLKAFAGEEKAIRQCLTKDSERKEILEYADRVAAQLALTAGEQSQTRKELLDSASELNKTLESEQEKHDKADGDLSRQCVDTSNTIESLNDRLNKIYRRREAYDDQGLPELDKALQNIAEIRQQLKFAIDDHEALTTRVAGLESEHEKKISEINEGFNKDQARRTRAHDKLVQDQKHEEQRHEHNLTKLDTQTQQEISAYSESRHLQRRELGELCVKTQTLVESAGLTPDEQRQINEALEAIEQRDEELRAVSDQLTEAKEKRNLATTDRSTAQRQFQDAETAVENAEKELAALRKELTPDTDSWLAQLRTDDPTWGETLGKVINQDLLMRPDLNPVFVEAASDTLMGWRLDLESLSLPDIAQSEDAIRARLNEKDAHLVEAIESCKNAKAAAEKSNSALAEREREVEQTAGRHRIHEKHLERAKSAAQTTKIQANQAAEQRRSELNRQLQEANKRLHSFDTQTQQNIREIEDRQAQQKMEVRGQWAARNSELQEAIEHSERSIDESAQKHHQRTQMLNEAYASRLKDEGINPEQVRLAREKKDTLKDEVQRIEQSQSDVFEYRTWVTHEWGSIDKLQSQLAEHEKTLDTKERERKEKQGKFDEVHRDLTSQIKGARIRAGEMATEISEAEAILLHFKDRPNESTDLPGNLKALTEQLRNIHRDLETLRQDVIKAIRKATSVLGRYESTQVYRAWNNLQEHRVSGLQDANDRYSEEFELSQTESLRLLLDRDLPQLRETLVNQFSSAAGELGLYLDSLKLLVREVNQTSGRLQRAINTDQQIDSISDIRVTLKPRIYEDESWLPLKNFVDSWRVWQHSNRAGFDIPGEDLVNDFHGVVTTLRSARVRGDIESMVDMSLQLRENGRLKDIRNDNDLLNASSTGLTYLAIMAIFIGITRHLAPDTNTRITWPVDELGTLSPTNISKLADMLARQNITMISACPKLDHGLSRFFDNKVSIDEGQIRIFETKDKDAEAVGNHLFNSIVRERTTEGA